MLVSEEMYRRVFNRVLATRRTIATKHEGDFVAYAVQSWR